MSFTVSSVPAAKDWLYTQLLANCTQDPAGVDLLVRYGDPGPYDPEDVVSVGKVERQTDPAYFRTNLSSGALDERYTITVDVDVARAGDDPAQAATDRAWTLVSQVEAVVRADPTFGGAVIYGHPGSQSSETSQWDDDHRYYLVSVQVVFSLRTVI